MRLAIVSPCYNEQDVLKDSAERLTVFFESLIHKGKISSDSFILYVNDGSKDSTWNIINELYENNPYVWGVNLVCNVGHQNAIMAGMMTVKDTCDAVITIDSDLQDDLNAMEEMVDRFKEGYDVVYGVKVSREADPFLKRSMAVSYYKIQDKLGVKAIYNHADFRLMSRRALEQLSLYQEKNLYLRGIIPLMGYKSATVDDVISERTAGKSKYTLRKMLKLAIDGITSFSIRPMHLIFAMGLLFLLVTMLIFVYVLVSFFTHHIVPGWTSLMLSVWFIGSVIMLSIGVVGEYIGKMYIEVKHRPLYNVDKILDKELKDSLSEAKSKVK
ncbi:glycosyltransferase family 2 protein [uncultured Bacteroides sp.]|uniref:glycosyltransferase family 2 protein n=1 Tax=uncultured Bacteroides sp. TaxID=162156 RepID=UPI002AA84798|nr:glycosyltransferase family 2 protein [uncultured Bacteroides sp.]